MADLLLPNGFSHHTLSPQDQEIAERLERLEMACGLMAQILSSANVPPLMKQALHGFATSVAAEKKKREGQ